MYIHVCFPVCFFTFAVSIQKLGCSGCLNTKAEIIPAEPGPGNAG